MSRLAPLTSLLLSLLLLALSLPSTLSQATVQQGPLTNGVPVIVPINQGDTHYWSYTVSPSDPLTGSPLLDLVFVLQVSEGYCDLYITDPMGVMTTSATYSDDGVLYTNRSGTATSINANGSIAYGAYSVQVYGVANDVYTLSVSMTQRLQLVTGVANRVGGINGSTQLVASTFSYADLWALQAGPVQLTVTLTVDDTALSAAAFPLSSVLLPSLYWAKALDVPAWNPVLAGSNLWSTVASGVNGAGQLYSIISFFDECQAAPCQYSFLVIPQQSQPVLPMLTLTTVDLTAAYDPALDYTLIGYTPAQLLGNVTITTPVTPLTTNAVHYYRFPVIDAQEYLSLTLLTPVSSTSIVVLISVASEFPDLSLSGSQWSFASLAGQTSSSLTITPADPYFTAGGQGLASQTLTMEGEYQVTVYAQAGGQYQLQLNVSDIGNLSAPLLATGQLYTGVINPLQVVYFRYLTPTGFNAAEMDLIFTCYNVSLYVSDFYSTPGPTASAAQNNVLAVLGPVFTTLQSSGLVVGEIDRGVVTDHVGVYYIAVYSRFNAPVPFSISATFTAHTVLSTNTSWVSDAPLLSGQIRYFDYQQPGLSTLNLALTLSIADATQFAAVYINIRQLASPAATNTVAYPNPNLRGTYSLFIVGNANLTGELLNTWSNQCTAVYMCVWQIAVYAPVGQNLLNYTLELDLTSATPTALPLALNAPVAGTLQTNNAVLGFAFQVTSYDAVNISVTLDKNQTRNVQVGVSRSVLFLANNGLQADFQLTAQFPLPASNQSRTSSLVFNPSSPVFGLNLAPNVGSPYIATFYIRLNLLGNTPPGAVAATNFTLLYSTSPYAGNISTLIPQSLAPSVGWNQSVPQNSVAYFACTAPPSAGPSTDVIVTVQPTVVRVQQQGFLLSLWWSTVQMFPSSYNNQFNASLAPGAPLSFVMSSTLGTALAPGQSVYFGVSSQVTQVLSVLCSVNTRSALTPSTLSTGWMGAAPAGYAAVIDFVVPGTFPITINSFIASVASDQTGVNLTSTTLPPFLLSTSVLAAKVANTLPTLSVLQASATYNYYVIPTNYLMGDYQAHDQELCTQGILGCLYHFMVYFPMPVQNWVFSVSGFVQSAPPTYASIAATVIPPTTTIASATVAAGGVNLYNISVPIYWLNSAVISVTLTPLDGGNPDLFATAPDLNRRFGLPTGNLLLPPQNVGNSFYEASRNVVGVDSLLMNVSDPRMASQAGFLPPLIQLAVVGTSASTYSLSVTTTGVTPTFNISGQLGLLPTDPWPVTWSGAGITTFYPVYQVTLPPSYDGSWDLMLNVFSAVGAVNTAFSYTVYLNTFPYLGLSSRNSFPASTWFNVNVNGGMGTAVVINQRLHPTIVAGTVLYVQLTGGGGAYRISASYTQRQPMAIGQTVTAAATSGQWTQYSLTVPATKIGGQWSTSVSFFAAVSSLNASVTPSHFLLLNLANTVNTTTLNPFSTLGNPPTSKASAGEQTLTISDVCTLPTCVWTFAVYSITNASYTFSIAPQAGYQRLIPGFIYGPAYTATAAMTYFTFSLPHPQMTATVTLQSQILGAYAGATTNADLFVSSTYNLPDLRFTSLLSITDTQYGTDTITIIPSISGGQIQRPVNTTWYVSVFGQRAGLYTLLVQATDPGQTPLFITNNQPATGVVLPGQSNYYQYNIGQVTSVTDLSLILSSNASAALQPSLYATFSYTHPGPVAGYLPTFLPYEMFCTTPTPSGVQQVTLNAKLSSSNVLPLQSQSSLYVAVYGGSATSAPSISYNLAVSLSKRITFTPPSSQSFTRVDAGSVQYFQFSFTGVGRTGLQALLVLTGLTSPTSVLPPVYSTDPSLSSLVDPVISTASSYTTSMAPPATITPTSLNAVMSIIPADCGAYPSSSTCLYKSLVYTAQSMPEYALAVTTYYEGDQAPLPSNASVLQSVTAGSLRFYYFDLSADILAFNVTLLTNNEDGNADVFLSNVQTHPNLVQATNAQWTSYLDPLLSGTYVEQIAVSKSDSRWSVGRYYVSVFGQRSSTYQLTLSTLSSIVPAPPVNPGSDSSSSSNSGISVVALAVLLPIIGVLAILAAIFFYLYKTKKVKQGSASASTPADASEAEPSTPSLERDWDIAAQDSPSVQMTPRTLTGRRLEAQKLQAEAEEQKDSEMWENA